MNRAEAITQQVKGFLTPEFTQQMPDGRTLNGLTDQAFQMVRDGYACGECLAIFAHYTVVCPICGMHRDVAADVQEAPQLWLDHLKERNSDEPYDKPAVVNPFMAADLDLGTDVETIPITKLRRKRR